MAYSGMLHRVVLVRTDVSEELSASIIRVGSSPILVTLLTKARSSSEWSGLTRTTRRNIPEDVILHGLIWLGLRHEALNLRFPLHVARFLIR
jgi:hypothetical protein